MRRTIRLVGVFLAPLILSVACDSNTSVEPNSQPQFSSQGNLPVAFVVDAPTFLGNANANGVFSDGQGAYVNAVGGLKAYIGVGGKNADLVTYATTRTLRFSFPTNSASWLASGIPAEFNAVSDFFGIIDSWQYRTMGIGTVARVHGDLEFYVGRITYELKYGSLAVKRLSETEWLITSDCLALDPEGCWNYGFNISRIATLKVIRRKAKATYGTVKMPLTFRISLI